MQSSGAYAILSKELAAAMLPPMVPSLTDINDTEALHGNAGDSPVLQASLSLLRQRWSAGCRDRETALRLLFLCWYCNIEPPAFTGVDEIPQFDRLCVEAFDALGGLETSDPEVCFVMDVMTGLAPWCFGEPEHWEAVGSVLRSRSSASRLAAGQFAGRGVYGEYFRHMLAQG